MPRPTPAQAISDRVYRLLLFVYPASFRHEYGAHMAQLFRDQCRDAVRQTGSLGVLVLWLALVPDLLRSALIEHIWEILHMPVEKLLRGSGLAAMSAGILWMSLFVFATEWLDWDDFSSILVAVFYVVIMLLFAFGLVGLQRHYPSRLFIQLSFGLAYFSIAWLIIGGLIALFTQGGWMLFISGFFLFAFSLALIGLIGLLTQAFSPWGILPAISAVFLIGFIVTGDEPTPPIQMSMGIAYGLGWVTLGYILWRTDVATPDSTLPA